MRLWSLHPEYLDFRGLVALWREGLLAQGVVAGKTAGYRQHPQLLRFWAQDLKEMGKGLLAKMLADLGIDRDEFWQVNTGVARVWRSEPMADTYNYPAEIERGQDGRYVVEFPDFGWGATDGATRDEALLEARDLLRELIAATMREGKDLPKPSRATRRRPIVVPPVSIALKAAFYEAFRKAGITQRRLARDLDVAESEVRRMLNPDHVTKAATIDRALRRLGKRVSVTVREAA